jgi:hypothetical protein
VHSRPEASIIGVPSPESSIIAEAILESSTVVDEPLVCSSSQQHTRVISWFFLESTQAMLRMARCAECSHMVLEIERPSRRCTGKGSGCDTVHRQELPRNKNMKFEKTTFRNQEVPLYFVGKFPL